MTDQGPTRASFMRVANNTSYVGVVYGGEETEHNGMKDRAMIMVIHH
jgi:hypothetical protein